jgi:hypothetical protein
MQIVFKKCNLAIIIFSTNFLSVDGMVLVVPLSKPLWLASIFCFAWRCGLVCNSLNVSVSVCVL